MIQQKKDISVLFIVKAGKRHGIGHLARMLQLAKFYSKSSVFIISDQKNVDNIKPLLTEYKYVISTPDNKLNILDFLKEDEFQLLICDVPQINRSLAHVLSISGIPMIVFDNRLIGSCSEIYLAPLPTYRKKSANFSDIFYTPIDTKFFLSESDNTEIKNILVTLGGSDPHNNAEKIVKALKDLPYHITVICGPFSKYNIEEQENVSVVSNVTDLLPYIQSNDLIFCGPGSTLLECLAAKKYVVAVAHSYHQYRDLSTVPNVYSLLGGIFLTSPKIKNSIQKSSIIKWELPENFNYQQWFLSLTDMIVDKPAYCPLCGSHDKYSLQRDMKQNQFLCNNCQSVYFYKFSEIIIEQDSDQIVAYNSENHLKDYKNSVLLLREDSNRRIQIIKKILPTPTNQLSYKLMDIGAEHGIFVQEALHNGFSAQGIELSEFARRMALDQHNINIIDDMKKVYDNGSVNHIVTVWNKLELLVDPLSYIKKISALLPIGGMLAFRISLSENQISESPIFFQITKKGGRLLVERAGFFVAKINEYYDSTLQEKFLEFYCIKRMNNELY